MLRERQRPVGEQTDDRRAYLPHRSPTVLSDVTLIREPAASLISRPLTSTLWPRCGPGFISVIPMRRSCCDPRPRPSAAFTSSSREKPPRPTRVGSAAFVSVHVLLGPSVRHPTVSTIGIEFALCGGAAFSGPPRSVSPTCADKGRERMRARLAQVI